MDALFSYLYGIEMAAQTSDVEVEDVLIVPLWN